MDYYLSSCINRAIIMCCPNTDPASFQSLLERSGDLTSNHYVISFKTDSHRNCLKTISQIEEILEPDSPDRNWIWIEGAPIFDSPITVHYAYSPAPDRNYNNRIATINSDLTDNGFEPQQFNFDKFPKRLSWCGHIDSTTDHDCCPAHRCLRMQPIQYAS